MDKTVVVAVERKQRHPLYQKFYTSTKKYKAHNENNKARFGDRVRIQEVRPLSKDKRWKVIDIVKAIEVQMSL